MSTFEDLEQNQIHKKPSIFRKMKEFWLKNGEKVILLVGIVIIALISFEAGFMKGQKGQNEPAEINQAACAPCPKNEKSANSTSNNASVQQNPQSKTDAQPNIDNQKCAFVASKNSNKYHLPTCQFAQKIKAENRICFSSKEEAESRGYQGAKCCIK
jgi:hypothetical protein